MLRFLIHTCLLIAFAALVLSAGTAMQYGFTELHVPYLSLVFFATMLDYNLHRLLKVKYLKNAEPANQWVGQNIVIIVVISILAVIGSLTSLIFIHEKVYWVLVLVAVVTLLYSVPFFKVRRVTGLKNLMIAVVWTIVTCYLPAMLSLMSFSGHRLMLDGTAQFLLILPVSFLFDIRDMKTDKLAGLTTIPTLLGKRNTFRWSNILVAAYLLVNFIGASENLLKMAVGLFTAIFAWLIINSKLLRQQTFYYHLYVDGILILNGLLLVILFY